MFNLNKKSETHISLSGDLDERATFPDAEFATDKEVIVDLNDLGMINSCGIRTWMKWFEKHKEVPFRFENIRPFVVDQMGMVRGFLPPKSEVVSFYAPYVDEDEEQYFHKYTVGENFDMQSPKLEPEVTVEGKTYEIDVIEDRYLSFTKK
jgi:hypothetical protein